MSTDPTQSTEYQLIGITEDGGFGDLLSGLDQKQGRVRLQALISEWLRMENLVVLTGSGTSVSAGGKTMANLETAVFATIEALPDIPASILPIIEARKTAVQNADLLGEAIGFEAWLSFVANARVVAETSAAPFSAVTWPSTPAPSVSDLSWFVDRLRMAIFAECALSLPDIGLAALSKLVARDSNLGRTHLFTLNYDTLFEQALELLGVQYFNGFTGRASARFDPSVYGLDVYYPGEIAEGRVRRFDKFLHFYKLHGSIHWFERGNEMRARHPDLARFQSYAALSPEDKAGSLVTLAGDTPAVGILPTANKFAQTLTMPYAHLFRSFQVCLYLNGKELGLPLWFLNAEEICAWLSAAEQTQEPVLKDWWAIAKGGNATVAASMGALQNAMSALDQLLSELTKIKKKAAGSYCDAVTGHLADTEIDTAAFEALFADHRAANDYNTEVMNNQAPIAAEAEKLKDAIRGKISDESGQAEAGARTADTPLPISRTTLTDPSLINRAVSKEDTFRVDAHLTILKLRLKTRLDDKRWRAFLNYEEADTKIENLSSWFARFGLGADTGPKVSVIDLSMLSNEVLPYACAVIGRVLLEARERLPASSRYKHPWVLVLEEAHNYARPARSDEDRGHRQARLTYERIAKEGAEIWLIAYYSQPAT